MAKKIFKEEQRFKSMDMIAMIGLFILLTLMRLFYEISNNDNSYSNEIFCMISILSLGFLIWFLLNMKIKLAVSKKNIKLKMKTWQKFSHKISWDNVQSCEVVKTSIWEQWHGGNITFNREKRFSFVGRNGILLTTKEGETYFIGTRKLKELENTIQEVLEITE